MGIEYKELIWNQFRIVQNKTRVYLHEFSKNCGVSLQEIVLLKEIAARPDVTLVEISQVMGTSKSTTSSMVSRLEERGIIIREVPKENRRIVRLRISPEFSKRPEIIKAKSEMVDGLLRDISEEDVSIIMAGLKRLEELLDTPLTSHGIEASPEESEKVQNDENNDNK